MTQALGRIEEDFDAFRDLLVKCQPVPYKRADWQDAYARLARVRDRYLKEKDFLAPSEQRALAKPFEHDTFFKGMMNLRQLGEHVIKRGPLFTVSVDNVPINLDCETSARSAFAAPRVILRDTQGEPQGIDHLQLLREAEKRIATALHNARS